MNNDNNNNKNKIRRKKVSSTDKTNSPSSNNTKKTTTSSSKPKKKDKFKFLRVTSIVFLVLLVVGVAGATGLVFSSLRSVEPITKTSLDDRTYQVSKIKYSTGEIMSNTPSSSKKEPVSISEMGPYLPKAIVAIEDERFYEHKGVDIMGLVRSVVKTLMGNTQGGSTIPMQVSKMLMTSSEKSIPRKIKDIYYAYEMSKILTKEEVLEVYLNNFFVGRGLSGAEAGARGYFDKKAKNLTLAESALLAGSTKHPTKYAAYMTAKLDGSEGKEDLENKLLFYINTPDDNFDDPTLVELEMVDKLKSWEILPDDATYKQLKSGTMVVRKAINNPDAKVRQEIVLGKMLELGYITEAEYTEAKNEEIEIKLPKPRETVASSVEDYIEYEVIDALVEQGNTTDEAYNMFYNGGIVINTTIDPSIQANLEDEYDDNSNFPGNKEGPNGILQPQSSMVILDYRNGQIKGLVGGRHITGRKGINRATEPQQPGSTIKPLSIYTPAIDTLKLTQSTALSDTRGGYKFDHGKWNPRTTTSGTGTMSLRKALALSSNPIAIKTAEMLGTSKDETIDVMMDYLKNFGISTVIDSETADSTKNDRNYPALTLGGMTTGISPLEMASAYGTLANGGVYIEPIIFTTITSYDGQLIVKNTPEEHKVVAPEVAYVVTDMLSAVVTEGTGKGAKISNGMPVAGKTGTTNSGLDAWFVGYTPYYVGATYIGDDAGVKDPNTEKSIPRRQVVGGSATPAKLWSQVMSRIHKNLTVTKFKVPENVYFAKINLIDGGRSSIGSSAAFINGTSPKRYTSQPSVTTKPDTVKPEQEETPPPTTEGGGGTTPPPPTEDGGGTPPPPTEDGGGTPPPPTEDGGGTPPPPEGGGGENPTPPPPVEGGGGENPTPQQ